MISVGISPASGDFRKQKVLGVVVDVVVVVDADVDVDVDGRTRLDSERYAWLSCFMLSLPLSAMDPVRRFITGMINGDWTKERLCRRIVPVFAPGPFLSLFTCLLG